MLYRRQAWTGFSLSMLFLLDASNLVFVSHHSQILHVVSTSCPRSHRLTIIAGEFCLETTTHEPHCDYYSTYTDLRLDGRCYRPESGQDGCLATEEMTTIVSECNSCLVCCGSCFALCLPTGMCVLAACSRFDVILWSTWDKQDSICAVTLTSSMILHFAVLFGLSSPTGSLPRMYPRLDA